MIKSREFPPIGSREFPLLSLVALIVPGFGALAFIILYVAFRCRCFSRAGDALRAHRAVVTRIGRIRAVTAVTMA